jgi:hypothetical protein
MAWILVPSTASTSTHAARRIVPSRSVCIAPPSAQSSFDIPFSGRGFARSCDGASRIDASRLSGATAPPRRRWHPRQRAHERRGAPARGEPEPRWARRPWRAERLAASSIVPPLARASLGWAHQQATAPAVAATPACELFTCAVQPAPLSVRSDTGTVGLPRA